MIFKAFEYEHSKENILEFLKFWISSEEFLKDIKKGSFVGSSRKTVRDVKHTIVISKNGLLELSIKKGAIVSDMPRDLTPGEIYLNENDGFSKVIKEIDKWLEDAKKQDPWSVDYQKALSAKRNFEWIGLGFYLETEIEPEKDIIHRWTMKISVGVVPLPK